MCYIYKEYSFRVYITIIIKKIRGYVVFIRIKKTNSSFFSSFGTCQPIVRHVPAHCSARASRSFVVRQTIMRRSTNNRMSFDKRLSDVRRTMTEVLMDADLHVAERLLPRLVLLIFAKGTVPAHVCIDGLVKAEHLLDHPWTHLKAIACGNLS